MSWIEQSASETRDRLGLKSFALPGDSDRLLEYEAAHGLEVRYAHEADCLGEIKHYRDRWRLKLSAALEGALKAEVTYHEIGHRHTLSRMTGICSPAHTWWWRTRDERNAALWCAHFRLPSDLLWTLLRKDPSWEDLSAECQAPDALLLLKLRCFRGGPGRRLRGQPGALTAIPPIPAPVLASQVYRIQQRQENVLQQSLGILKIATGERWIFKRATNPDRLAAAFEELSWDLLGWSEARFWARWEERLEPVIPWTDRVRWSNPKPGK